MFTVYQLIAMSEHHHIYKKKLLILEKGVLQKINLYISLYFWPDCNL